MIETPTVKNTYGEGKLDETFVEMFFRVSLLGADSFTMNRTPCVSHGVEDGLILVILRREVAELVCPHLARFITREFAKNRGNGKLEVDHTATVAQVFEWVDSIPPKCAAGPLLIQHVESGKTLQAFVFAFAGNALCSEVRAELERLGVKIERKGGGGGA